MIALEKTLPFSELFPLYGTMARNEIKYLMHLILYVSVIVVN
jgi:hypothetical protein